MSTIAQYPHIIVDEAGVPRISASRYKVLHLVGEHYHLGWSAEELLRQHPDLKPEEVYASLAYFYDHYADLVQQLGHSAERSRQRSASPLSRDELLGRRKVAE